MHPPAGSNVFSRSLHTDILGLPAQVPAHENLLIAKPHLLNLHLLGFLLLLLLHERDNRHSPAAEAKRLDAPEQLTTGQELWRDLRIGIANWVCDLCSYI